MGSEDNLAKVLLSQFDDKFTVHHYSPLQSTSLAGGDLLAVAQKLIKSTASKYQSGSCWRDVKESRPVLWTFGECHPACWMGGLVERYLQESNTRTTLLFRKK